MARKGERKIAYSVSVGKTEVRRRHWIYGRRWEDNIKVGLKEIWGGCKLNSFG